MSTTLYICPGIHPKNLTTQFIRSIKEVGVDCSSLIVLPTSTHPPFSPLHVLSYLQEKAIDINSAIVFIGFSAGVVGAIGAAHLWQLLGGKVAAFFALDGWGVPILGPFPLYRLSHDQFTDWSNIWWGKGQMHFYADPPVNHLSLWNNPQHIQGWSIQTSTTMPEISTPTTAALFLRDLLRRYKP